jgi:ZIP family zinc transporter
MSTGEILVLGAIAGFTIYLGLPIGRIRNPAPGLRALLNAVAIGILVFLLWDVLSHAVEPLEAALTAAAIDHRGSWSRFAGLAATFVVCLGGGLLSLVYYERWMTNRARAARLGPGAARVEEFDTSTRKGSPLKASTLTTSPARRLALFIAIGIGLHNFSEGLAIGQSAAKGEVSLALLLIIGFGLHNATEGFGIVAPLAGEADRPSWAMLGMLGLIGGGPTFVGTVIGQSFVNDTLFMGFLALAAGSILYVVIQLLGVGQRLGHKELLMWGILGGMLVGFATDFILVAAGA